jgi:dolichol kinase
VLGATVASVGLLRWLAFPAPLAPLVAISIVCALVEVLLTGVDDNVSVPLVGGLLALTLR